MATSEKRIAANRENARRSTGPRTTEGKDRARRNGITHGLTTTAMLLDDEDPDTFNAFVDDVLADLGPRSEHERALALNVANTIWRRDRLYAAEVAFMNLRNRALRAENPDLRSSAEAVAALFLDPSELDRMRLLARYLNSAERACNKALQSYWSARNAALESELEEARLTDQLVERSHQAALAALERSALDDLETDCAAVEPPPASRSETVAVEEPCQTPESGVDSPSRAPVIAAPRLNVPDPHGFLARLIAEGKLSPNPLEEELQ